jgi:uncharacterized protein YijF (DUF1287 family)
LHIGIVSDVHIFYDDISWILSLYEQTLYDDLAIYGMIHNIGRGQMNEDCLFNWKIIGHYRYLGNK